MSYRVNIEVRLVLAGPMDATDNSVEASELEAAGLDADTLAALVCDAIRDYAGKGRKRSDQPAPKPPNGDYPLDPDQD